MAQDDNDLLTIPEVAKMTHRSPDGLAQLRFRGGGPVFVKTGTRSVRYRRADVVAWIMEHRMITVNEKVGA